MAENTKIEWCHHTFNPWIGCTKVSPACDHCYAEAWSKRYGRAQWGNHPRQRTSAANWRQPLKWNREAAERGVRYRVFCASLADVFDNKVPAQWRSDLFALIEDTTHLDWLLLTKRPQNIADMIWPKWDLGLPRNVWLGTTAENQQEADRRIPHLIAIRAAVRFLSCEPLLGPLDLSAALAVERLPLSVGPHWTERMGSVPKLDWIIAGGESGADARPPHPDWIRSLRDQCAAAGVAFHFKQWGEWGPAIGLRNTHWIDKDGALTAVDDDPRKFGGRTGMRRVGKVRAGRMLDGVIHHEFPRSALPLPTEGAER